MTHQPSHTTAARTTAHTTNAPRRAPRPLAATALTASAVAVAAAAVLTGCGAQGAHGGKPVLSVSGAYVPRPPLADMAAGYFTVRNTGGTADELTSVTTSFASEASLMVTSANGAMTSVTHLAIPAGGSLRLSVGGDHLMLMGLRGGRPEVGVTVPFVLHFARSAPITVRVPVEPATYRPKD